MSYLARIKKCTSIRFNTPLTSRHSADPHSTPHAMGQHPQVATKTCL